ncbi:hypothetical protein B0H17DRAFT_1027931 [Mycena rosella]|uniref:HNH nuclease domain-containing protein n=1 Tax=Mycena rosella TaxID=1033263 RepID=A0AAD7MCZ9_MYCRO|nr:hypothetical protein B0H17DRAFT_1027931 [Mycena rosella]
MTNTIRLHLQIEGHWRPFLEIPGPELARFSLRPIKWLRYLGWCIYGQPGWLSTTPGGLEVAGDAQPDVDYYYVSNLPARFIDVNAIDDRTSNSSQHNQRPASFRQDLIDRDTACIITEAPPNDCTACHILPHSKGDEYISCLSSLRADQDDFPVVEIGDIRNGLLLYNGLHRPFGDGEIAFLLTPNPYLLPEDIPSDAPSTAPPPPDTARLTLQHIVPQMAPNLIIAPHNRDVRLSPTDMRPSAYLLHFFYACAILKRWGQSSRPYLLARDIQSAYYNRESPYVSDEDERDPPAVTGWPASSSRGLPPFGGHRSLSDVMDDLLSLHLLSTSNEPLNTKDASVKVLSWLNDTGMPLLA